MELPQAHQPPNTNTPFEHAFRGEEGLASLLGLSEAGLAGHAPRRRGECESQWDWSLLPKLGDRTKKKHEFYLEINPDSKPTPALSTDFLLPGLDPEGGGKMKGEESRREFLFQPPRPLAGAQEAPGNS